MPLSSTKTNCCGSRLAISSRQAARCSSLRSQAASDFFMRPAQPTDRPPHRGLAQLLALVLRPPGTVLQHGGIRLAANASWAARNRLARQQARRALLHHGMFDGGHGNVETARGFSLGQTVRHRAHQALFQVGRIGTQDLVESVPYVHEHVPPMYAREVGL